ncbi:MAG: BamA/TamA family outer membrane protein [Acidobacteria bacterium]|nr:BamA/TamA family outer membrane protein [Acidobacteriota bacterium]
MRRLVPLLVLLLALALAACHEEGTIRVRSFKLEGVKAVDAGRLKSALVTKQSSKLPWGEKRRFDRRKLEADLQRVEAFYADRGYPDARVTSFDVKLNQAQDQVDIAIVIAEGAPIVVHETTFSGFGAIPQAHFDELGRRVPLRAGQPRDRQLLQVTREMAVNELRDHGHPYAEVTAAEEGKGEKRVTVIFTANPGPVARFGPIDVVGNRSVGDEVVRRELTYKPGELFRVSQMQESQRKLYSLELFQFVNVEANNPERSGLGARPTEVPTTVTVGEGKHRRVKVGVGYGSEEQARAQGEWRHVNFFGGARTANALAKWSSLDRGVRFGFTQPYIFGPDFSFSLNGQQWYANEPAYRLTTRGGRATLVHRTLDRGPLARDQHTTTMSLSLIREYEEYAIDNEALLDLKFRDDLIALGLDPTTGYAKGTLTAVGFDVQRNTTNSLLDASTGYVATVHLEQAGRWLPGTFRYVEVSGEGRHYWPIAGRLVLANRIRAASIDGPGPKGVPFFKRYFLGGSTSLRGWGRFEVSPLSGSGLPIGGASMLELSSEVRVPLVGNLTGVLFLDGGNVWPDAWDVNLNDLRYAAGPGLRYNTPIGPIRFDVGRQLNPIPGLLVDGEPEKRHWRMHISIGQAF